MTDPLRPTGSRAWTPVSRERAQMLMRSDHKTGSYEVEFKRFLGDWQPIRADTQHEPRTSYRARSFNWP